jgi:hypothetical protein
MVGLTCTYREWEWLGSKKLLVTAHSKDCKLRHDATFNMPSACHYVCAVTVLPIGNSVHVGNGTARPISFADAKQIQQKAPLHAAIQF